MKKYRAHNWHCFGQLENRTPYAVIYTSLGCPFSCKFCCINAIFGQNTMRRRSPEKVVAEIGSLVNDYHVRNIKIMDEMFVLHKDHVLEICDRIIRKGYDLNMWAYARIDTVSPDLLKQMKKAGINWVGLGIESGNQRILRGINKGITVEKIKNAVQMTHDAGLYIGANYIFGLPDDDDQSMRDTFNLAKELNCEYANFYVAMAYPGSMLYQEAISKGWKLPENWLGYSQYSPETMPLPTNHLSAAQVLQFRDWAFEAYHGGPEYLAMIGKKFGPATLSHIRQILQNKLQRKILSTIV